MGGAMYVMNTRQIMSPGIHFLPTGTAARPPSGKLEVWKGFPHQSPGSKYYVTGPPRLLWLRHTYSVIDDHWCHTPERCHMTLHWRAPSWSHRGNSGCSIQQKNSWLWTWTSECEKVGVTVELSMYLILTYHFLLQAGLSQQVFLAIVLILLYFCCASWTRPWPLRPFT